MSDAFCCTDPNGCTYQGGSGDQADGGVCNVDCAKLCGIVAPNAGPYGFNSCYAQGDGTISYYCGSCGVGRVPGGTAPCPLGETVADRLARQAYYEGVSVLAFEHLADTLASAGAPAELVLRARRAAGDEARHAAIFRALATSRGATVPAIALDQRPRSLFELAVENATEGCVRETLGAAVTLHQAEHAEAADVRAAFAAIAEDEAEHAALSWELRAWFDGVLDPTERALVTRAHEEALASARRESEEPDAAGVAVGLPAIGRAQRMLDLAVRALAQAA